MNLTEPCCFRCGVTPDRDPDIVWAAEDAGTTPAEEVKEDGTYNPIHQTYCCTGCYLEIGIPSSPQGWKAPARIS